MPADPVDEAAERLYGLPFEDFTRERDATAKELRKAGEKDAAAEVAKLPKPSQVAYAANLLARSGDADDMLAAGERLRKVQLGGGDRDEVREAAAEERDAVEALVAASDLSRAAQDRLRTLLHAVASDEALREAFAAGRLVKEPEGGGWPSGDFVAVPTSSRPAPKQKAKEKKPTKRETERKRKEDERREREATRKREEAERRKLERRLKAARDSAEEAKRRLDAAQEAYENATHEVARIEEQLG